MSHQLPSPAWMDQLERSHLCKWHQGPGTTLGRGYAHPTQTRVWAMTAGPDLLGHRRHLEANLKKK